TRPLPLRRRHGVANRSLGTRCEEIADIDIVCRIPCRVSTEPVRQRPVDLGNAAVGRQLQHAERQAIIVGETGLQAAQRLGDPCMLLCNVGDLPQRPWLAFAAPERRRNWPDSHTQPTRGARASILSANAELLLAGFAALDGTQQPEKALTRFGLA